MSVELLRRAAELPDTFRGKVCFGDGCWDWVAGRSSGGYGRYWLPAPTKRFVQAHRFVYEALVGPIPAGAVLDHTCRNRSCVRPDHLEPVEPAENTRRGMRGRMVVRCVRGHDYTVANTYLKPSGQRDCRECRRLRKRRDYRARSLEQS